MIVWQTQSQNPPSSWRRGRVLASPFALASFRASPRLLFGGAQFSCACVVLHVLHYSTLWPFVKWFERFSEV